MTKCKVSGYLSNSLFIRGHFLDFETAFRRSKKYVGAGWSNLLDVIYDRLLRFSVEEADDELYDFIEEMEVRSFGICEVCGVPGKVREGGWLKTLCMDHLRPEDKVSLQRRHATGD